MKFSLVHLTYRPGGIDLLAESLQHQDPAFYELIVVDDFPGRVERGIAKKHLLSKNIPLTAYVKSKPHSYPEKRRCGLANAMNTGALYANTDYLVFAHDFMWFGPNCLCQWIVRRQMPANSLITGIASRRIARQPEIENDDITIWPKGNPAWFLGPEEELWVPSIFESFYFGVPMNFMEAINGFDERTDENINWSLKSIIAQADFHDYYLIVDHRNRIEMADHRQWPNKEKFLIRHNDGEMPVWEPRSPNPFTFRRKTTKTVEANGVLV